MSRDAAGGADSRTRQKILRTTLDWAAETGLLRLSMNEVAKRARIARATLYLHFPGKQALIDAAMDHEITEMAASLREVVNCYDSVEERAVRGFAHAYRLIKANTILQAVLQLNPQALVPHIVGATPTLARGRAVAEELLRPDDLPEHLPPEVVGEFAVRMMMVLVLAPPPSVDLDRPGGPEDWARCFLLPVLQAPAPTLAGPLAPPR
ncbi:TetR/AcrR family transcriptional regulator [Mycolicibacillus trivialis]|uniref:TetR/AcrR family transcriptional regulator n=1 Tax=Mycolicibacillus trivialis TaxID=1798 RepID=UPI0013FD8F02|nr:TetR/AcrR family transcriptional regulator [Mycolicibacillus trivialis]